MKSLLSPSVYGHLLDRYLFNFRVESDVLESHLPGAKWLKPRLVNGSGVVSFCLLNLEGVTLWPLPTGLGFDTTSCAYRCAVVDHSGPKPEPSVYVIGRNTNLPIAGRFGSILFSGTMKMIHSSIQRKGPEVKLDTSFMDGQQLFSATIKPAEKNSRNSRLFGSLESFVDFIKGGASSYTPSSRSGQLSRVDLAEDSSHYEPVEATIGYNWLAKVWPDANLVFDSAYRASGGLYRLKYLGSLPVHQENSKELRKVEQSIAV